MISRQSVSVIQNPMHKQQTASSCVGEALETLQTWMQSSDYAGYEPYDMLNSPYLKGRWARRQPLATLMIQSGKHFGMGLRRLFRVPASKNPKTIGLVMSAYCDLASCRQESESEARYLKLELQRLRSPHEQYFCWGYDWDYVALRGTKLTAFSPNCIATYFCANALLDMAAVFGDLEAVAMAKSAGQFLVQRLNRSVDTKEQICFSYSPNDHTRIYNNSGLAGALLARLTDGGQQTEYLTLARRSMRYLADQQRPDGSWTYGAGRVQNWIDGFHTGYNLCALLEYRRATGDASFDPNINCGYEFYKRSFFREDGAPKYFNDRVYPIDIHSCAQAILTFCAFCDRDPEAFALAQRTAHWTIQNMRSPEGYFFYQHHRLRTDRTPYMRWGQAWMFRALARLQAFLASEGGNRTYSAGVSAAVNAHSA